MLAAVVAAAVAAAAPIPAAPTRWVTDTAGFMSEAARAALDAKLEGYERATGHQVVVWIGKTIGGADLADWAVRTFAAWRVGRKGLDDGIAMFVLADDRKIDIEVGYGLEDRVPDAIASRIIREVMAPKLRAGDRDAAITAGADAILAAIEGKPWTGVAPAAETRRPVSPVEWVIGGLALLGFLIFAVTHPRMALLFLWTFMGRGGGGGGGFGGGGFSGGGGSSGGGGARGGW
jgi:uncharacterized protein